jgi:hypothetical protein
VLDGFNRDSKYQQKLDIVKSEIKIGDNIFEAKIKLQKNGFKIKYGPDHPTTDKAYYLMLIDFGIQPSVWEKFKYTVGIDFNGRPRSGKVKASALGKIVDIR